MKGTYSMRRLISCAILIIFLLSNSFSPVDSAILLDRVVALVNKEVITWSELYQMMEREATDEMKSLDEEGRLKIFKENEEFFLERLIDIRLQVQEAERLGIEATTGDIEDAILNIKTKYDLSDDAFKESLEKEGLTLEEYKEKLSEQIMMSKLINQQIRSKIVVSDEEVNDYLNKNRDQLIWDDSYKLRQIFFKSPESDDIKSDIEEKASNIIEKLEKGENFSHLAKEYSEDPSKNFGGDLGYIQKNVMAEEFIDVLSDMEVGDFSMPFWTEKGLHIIKLEDKKSAQTIEEVKETIKKQIRETKFMKIYERWIKDLRNGAHIVKRL